jgi:hypothetical protein
LSRQSCSQDAAAALGLPISIEIDFQQLKGCLESPPLQRRQSNAPPPRNATPSEASPIGCSQAKRTHWRLVRSGRRHGRQSRREVTRFSTGPAKYRAARKPRSTIRGSPIPLEPLFTPLPPVTDRKKRMKAVVESMRQITSERGISEQDIAAEIASYRAEKKANR